MITITPDIRSKYAKAFRSARKDRMRVVWLEDDLVYVARRKRGHGQYLIRFFAVQGIDGETKVKAQCNTITGGACDGTRWHEMCSHLAKILLRGVKHKKKDKAEGKAA